MSNPQMTAMIANQHRQELHSSAQQARRVKQAKELHGIRVVHRTAAPQAPRSAWTRIVAVLGKTASVVSAPEPKLA
jgi:hypothetical protein